MQSVLFKEREDRGEVNLLDTSWRNASLEVLTEQFSCVFRHFKWMADYGVDGAFLQRSIKERTDGIRRIREEVGRNVQKAAENTGRVFAIMSVSPSASPS